MKRTTYTSQHSGHCCTLTPLWSGRLCLYEFGGTLPSGTSEISLVRVRSRQRSYTETMVGEDHPSVLCVIKRAVVATRWRRATHIWRACASEPCAKAKISCWQHVGIWNPLRRGTSLRRFAPRRATVGGWRGGRAGARRVSARDGVQHQPQHPDFPDFPVHSDDR